MNNKLKITTTEGKKYSVEITDENVILKCLTKKDLTYGAEFTGFFADEPKVGQEAIFLINNIDEWISYTGKKPNNKDILMIGYIIGTVAKIDIVKE